MQSWLVRAPGRELRGDERKLYIRVRQTLWDYEPLRASHAQMQIEVHGNDVWLRGRVRTLSQRSMAEVLVRRMDGVASVQSDLVADADVIRSVADELAADARTAPYVPRVECRHGLVVLRGNVPNESVRQSAIEVASLAPLVAGVRDELTLGGPTFQPYALGRKSDATADDVGAVDAAGETRAPALAAPAST